MKRKESAARIRRNKSAKKNAGPGAGLQQTRLWLMYPPKLITTPVVWQLSRKFKVITNVRQASVTDEIGIVCLELDGERSEISQPSNGWKILALALSRSRSMSSRADPQR